MNRSKLVLSLLGALLLQLPSRAAASDFLITSPDHPAVWYNLTGDKVDQYLDWNSSANRLVLHVAYSKGGSTSYDRDQTLLDSFRLTFPTVHLDSSSNRLYTFDTHHREVAIGHLESGVFGSRVVLAENVQFSAHRRNGVVNAVIKSVDR